MKSTPPSPGTVRLLKNSMLNAEPQTSKVWAITQRNQNASPLLGLPGDVRNRILKYGLGGLKIFILRNGKAVVTYGDHQFDEREQNAFLPIQQTCRILYSETALLPFSQNWWWYYNMDDLNKFIPRVLPGQLNAVSTMFFSVSEGRELEDKRLRGLRHFPCVRQVFVTYKDRAFETSDDDDSPAPWVMKLAKNIQEHAPADVAVIYADFNRKFR